MNSSPAFAWSKNVPWGRATHTGQLLCQGRVKDQDNGTSLGCIKLAPATEAWCSRLSKKFYEMTLRIENKNEWHLCIAILPFCWGWCRNSVGCCHWESETYLDGLWVNYFETAPAQSSESASAGATGTRVGMGAYVGAQEGSDTGTLCLILS